MMTLIVVMGAGVGACAAEVGIAFQEAGAELRITLDGRPFATYVLSDRQVLRPYFKDIFAVNGKRVTRNQPPVVGRDAMDHPTFHPGIWLAFGDISGADFWRNKATVDHVRFERRPVVTQDGGGFAVRNVYRNSGAVVCDEVCAIQIAKRPFGVLLDWRSEFTGTREFVFGDQEEMGLGVRVATPLAVKQGGTIANAEGLRNEKGVFGKPSKWCAYGGNVNGNWVGLTIMPSPGNFRPCRFHARDYGVLMANPFGQKCYGQPTESRIVVKPGETLELRFGVLVSANQIDHEAAWQDWSARVKSER